MREDLLGYLLGALEPEEAERVEELLESDPEARAELQRLEQSLRPFEEAEEIFEPPANLIANTLDAIESSKVSSATGSGLAEALPSERDGRHRRWRIPDVIVAAGSLIAIGGLLFPALLEGRFEARREHCQDNLRELGVSLTSFATRDIGQRLPAISLDGPLAFAGVFSVELKDRGLLDSDNLVWCASRDRTKEIFGIPTKVELSAVSGVDLETLQRNSGGHLAYTLGVMDRGQYVTPRYEGRSSFAILGDAPIRTLDGWQLAHDGRGYNLLFEDGRVCFVSRRSQFDVFDHPFVNEDNRMEAGLNLNDASLGESSRAPFVWVKQSSR